ncbi:MAG TPA: cyclic pyranopterin monophosphate synthase MoaC [Candidatus Ventricola gallistercoris]|nr:cyclic pyranopterin monophosphate synthase MoaC [Candidatus Ventricola gallistercoris]
MIEKLTHFDSRGQAVMVDVTAKAETDRTAIAKGRIRVSAATMQAILEGTAKKGDVLGVARVAGIMAVKRTSELIPMCHPLMLGRCSVDFNVFEEAGEIEAVCTASLKGQTGVEMEALTGVSVALLTIYDMCKAIDKRMEITGIHLAKKTGGKSGVFINDPQYEEERSDD